MTRRRSRRGERRKRRKSRGGRGRGEVLGTEGKKRIMGE
jgi:hypothetical protein